MTPFSFDSDTDAGPDWRNALSEWVQEHAYYPSQAAIMAQQGSPRVVMTVGPDGKVTSIELEKRSGSQWLDLALLGLFRGAKLPPPPKQPDGEPFTLHFTMNYILIR